MRGFGLHDSMQQSPMSQPQYAVFRSASQNPFPLRDVKMITSSQVPEDTPVVHPFRVGIKKVQDIYRGKVQHGQQNSLIRAHLEVLLAGDTSLNIYLLGGT